MTKWLLAPLLMLTAAPGVASAQAITADNPQGIVNILQAEGYKASLRKDDGGDPLIESASGGSTFLIFFFGCEKNVKCTSIQFYAGFDRDSVALAKINEWNAGKRFGRAYLHDDGDPRIEMDVDLDFGGVSRPLFVDHLNVWTSLMARFEEHIG